MLYVEDNTVVGVQSVSEQKLELPSVLTQDRAHESRSKRYSLVKTSDVIKMFEDSGFTWKKISEERCRGSYAGFGTHLLAFEHPDISFGDMDRELKARLYLRNSYHGRSGLVLELGLFRAYCQNGLFIGMMLESFRKKHIGLKPTDIQTILSDMKGVFANRVVPYLKLLKETEVSKEEQVKFAELALKERFRSREDFISGEHEKLLTCHRDEDMGDSLWKVLNRVQENLGLNFRPQNVDISYRYNGQDKEGNNEIKERKVTKISRIGEVTYLNRFLFDKITEYLPEEKRVIMLA